MKFNYQARTKTGEIQSGTIEASSREAAFNVLKAHDLYVTALEPVAVPFYARRIPFLQKTTKGDIVAFSRQLAIMLKSNVPLVETFKAIADQTRKINFKEKILKVAEEVEGGTSLSKALSLYPKLFSSFYVSMVKSGEASGKLTDVFLYLANFLEREQMFRGKIKSAMIYPAFILIVFLGVVSIIMVFVIPQLSAVLKETGQELPLITTIVISISEFMKNNGIITLLIFSGFVFSIYRLIKSKPVKRFLDIYLLKMPLIGGFLKKLYLARFALNLSTLISGGLPIVQALQITGEVVENHVYQEIIFETRDEVRRGETISSVLERYPKAIYPLFFQMVMVGEKTGTLDSSLTNVVDFYQMDVDRSLDGLIKLIEPISILLLGGVVAGLMAAVLMPLYSIEVV